MPAQRNEISYYPEIQAFIEAQIKSNFTAAHRRELSVFWGIGELKKNLHKIIEQNPQICACARAFEQSVPPLNLDIFALITDGVRFELLILEVKRMESVGLKEWSQLVGYCLVSGAKYGLLVNTDGGASSRLVQLLQTQRHLSHIETLAGGRPKSHCLGLMYWDSLTRSFDYSNLGFIKSLSALSADLINNFEP